MGRPIPQPSDDAVGQFPSEKGNKPFRIPPLPLATPPHFSTSHVSLPLISLPPPQSKALTSPLPWSHTCQGDRWPHSCQTQWSHVSSQVSLIPSSIGHHLAVSRMSQVEVLHKYTCLSGHHVFLLFWSTCWPVLLTLPHLLPSLHPGTFWEFVRCKISSPTPDLPN